MWSFQALAKQLFEQAKEPPVTVCCRDRGSPIALQVNRRAVKNRASEQLIVEDPPRPSHQVNLRSLRSLRRMRESSESKRSWDPRQWPSKRIAVPHRDDLRRSQVVRSSDMPWQGSVRAAQIVPITIWLPQFDREPPQSRLEKHRPRLLTN